ncbi:MAG: hypothetical protein E5W03_12165, partial [Mesorhizobium sp.]
MSAHAKSTEGGLRHIVHSCMLIRQVCHEQNSAPVAWRHHGERDPMKIVDIKTAVVAYHGKATLIRIDTDAGIS